MEQTAIGGDAAILWEGLPKGSTHCLRDSRASVAGGVLDLYFEARRRRSQLIAAKAGARPDLLAPSAGPAPNS
jgi:hypothetical protein